MSSFNTSENEKEQDDLEEESEFDEGGRIHSIVCPASQLPHRQDLYEANKSDAYKKALVELMISNLMTNEKRIPEWRKNAPVSLKMKIRRRLEDRDAIQEIDGFESEREIQEHDPNLSRERPGLITGLSHIESKDFNSMSFAVE